MSRNSALSGPSSTNEEQLSRGDLADHRVARQPHQEIAARFALEEAIREGQQMLKNPCVRRVSRPAWSLVITRLRTNVVMDFPRNHHGHRRGHEAE